ncbi:MAG: hypothetical protein ACTHJ8_08485 [Mucilaginibacter sp.]
MRKLLKISLVAVTVSVLASGCFGCGNRTSSEPEEPAKVTQDSPKQTIDTAKAAIDTVKKDTSKK